MQQCKCFKQYFRVFLISFRKLFQKRVYSIKLIWASVRLLSISFLCESLFYPLLLFKSFEWMFHEYFIRMLLEQMLISNEVKLFIIFIALLRVFKQKLSMHYWFYITLHFNFQMFQQSASLNSLPISSQQCF